MWAGVPGRGDTLAPLRRVVEGRRRQLRLWRWGGLGRRRVGEGVDLATEWRLVLGHIAGLMRMVSQRGEMERRRVGPADSLPSQLEWLMLSLVVPGLSPTNLQSGESPHLPLRR